MQKPIYTAFYTRGTIYEHEAARLRASLERLNLEHDIRAIESRGDWVKNSRHTASHVCEMIEAYPRRPIVQLDADAVVHSHPALFDEPGDCDLAVHYVRGKQLANGTVWINATPAARQIIARYRELIELNPGCCDEQKMLEIAVAEAVDLARCRRLPASYCWICDIHQPGDLAPGKAPVIEHLQASRVERKASNLANRIRRIKEIESVWGPVEPMAAER